MKRKFLNISGLAGLLFATVANGQLTVEQAELIDEGFRIFMEETFAGNGRTCGTCHIPIEGYNIFPASLEKLNKKELALVFASNIPELENVDLIQSHALFNVSGGPAPLCPASNPECFDDDDGHSGPIFRGSMAVQALALTTQVDENVVDRGRHPGTLLLPEECSDGVELMLPQLGWAGDGSPGTPKVLANDPNTPEDESEICQTHHGHFDADADGSVRAFATGAIAQHFPLTLDRIPGVDFRRATADELDALEAFQLWLGRRPLTDAENLAQGTVDATEFEILLLDFMDPRVALGRDHYETNDGATCNRCHLNGGALGGGSGGNNNTITNVSLAADDIGVPIVGAPLPDDEGTIVNAFAGRDSGRLLGAFNTQSIIEAAKKKAWFHNHKVVEDFEESIAHYGTEDFLVNGPNGRPIGGVKPEGGLIGLQFGGQEVGAPAFPAGDGIEHLGTFLRALNAFYDLRDCERLLREAIERIGLGVPAENAIEHCQFNLLHVIRVLEESKLPGLHTDVQHEAKQVHSALNGAITNRNIARIMRLNDAIRAMRDSIATQVVL